MQSMQLKQLQKCLQWRIVTEDLGDSIDTDLTMFPFNFYLNNTNEAFFQLLKVVLTEENYEYRKIMEENKF